MHHRTARPFVLRECFRSVDSMGCDGAPSESLDASCSSLLDPATEEVWQWSGKADPKLARGRRQQGRLPTMSEDRR
jgi:hypothetical protein